MGRNSGGGGRGSSSLRSRFNALSKASQTKVLGFSLQLRGRNRLVIQDATDDGTLARRNEINKSGFLNIRPSENGRGAIIEKTSTTDDVRRFL